MGYFIDVSGATSDRVGRIEVEVGGGGELVRWDGDDPVGRGRVCIVEKINRDGTRRWIGTRRLMPGGSGSDDGPPVLWLRRRSGGSGGSGGSWTLYIVSFPLGFGTVTDRTPCEAAFVISGDSAPVCVSDAMRVSVDRSDLKRVTREMYAAACGLEDWKENPGSSPVAIPKKARSLLPTFRSL